MYLQLVTRFWDLGDKRPKRGYLRFEIFYVISKPFGHAYEINGLHSSSAVTEVLIFCMCVDICILNALFEQHLIEVSLNP